MRYKRRAQTGFTLLEVLLVIAMIGILSAIVIIAINPAQSLAKTRNGQRYADTSTILGAIYQYSLDHNGNIPADIPIGGHEICNTASVCEEGYIDLHELTDNEKYLVTIPKDPTGATEMGSGYVITRYKFNSRIIVSAPNAELGEDIRVSR